MKGKRLVFAVGLLIGLLTIVLAALGTMLVSPGWRVRDPAGRGTYLEVISKRTHESLCGPVALLAVCRFFEVETNLGELAALSGWGGNGTTMYGLSQAAVTKGLEATAYEIGVDELAAVGQPSIAFVRNNHFVAIVGFEGDMLHVIDMGYSSWVRRSDFAKTYSGKVLMFSRGKSASPIRREVAGAAISFEEYSYDFGLVEQDQHLEHSFRFRNRGNSALLIAGVRSSCTCVAALPTKIEVPPGESGEINVKLDTGKRYGGNSFQVYVESNDEDDPAVVLFLIALVRAGIGVNPKTVNFGEASPGQSVERGLTVVIPEGGSEVISGVTSSSPCVTVGKMVRSRGARYQRTDVSVVLAAGAPTGRLDGKISILLSGGNQSQIDVPIEGYITTSLGVSPEEFFFGLVNPGEQGKAKVRVFTLDGSSFEITGVRAEGFQVGAHEIRSVVAGREYEVEVGVGGGAEGDTIKGTVLIYTDHPAQPCLSVPMRGLVKPRGSDLPRTVGHNESKNPAAR